MTSRMLFTLTLLVSFAARADLLERMNLEEALRGRLEQIVHTQDKSARVLTRVEYKTLKTDLPGTSSLVADEFSPTKLESADITRVYIEVYTEQADVAADVKESIYRLIPVPRAKIQLVAKRLEPSAAAALRPVEAKDLSQIAQESIQSIAKILFMSMGAFMVLVVGATIFYSSRKMKEFKEQFNLLAKAISEGGGERPSALPGAGATAALTGGRSSVASESGMAALKNLPACAIEELLADCYWCEADAYAHWLWKNLTSEQRSHVMSSLRFMKEYSLSFVLGPAQEQGHHEHPFYLNPNSCAHLSMHDVNGEIQKNLALWHQLSPLRQSHSDINLEQKLTVLQMPPSAVLVWSSLPPSTPRLLKSRAAWGEISSQDEELLCQNPALVPSALRENIRSLVWLAQRDSAYIQKTLARFDARSLASAWIGSETVLKKLEESLPEKKLKLLLTYKDRVSGDRGSYVYQALVEEGLKNEEAKSA